MKKIVVTIGLVFLILLQTIGNCYAEGYDWSIKIVFEGELPFYYQGEEKANYKILERGGSTIYTFDRNNEYVADNLGQEIIYENQEYQEVLNQGYPAKTMKQLGTNTQIEAYIATQEAIYNIKENKDPSKYVAEDEQGQRIINAMAKIMKEAKQPSVEEDVYFEKETKQWKEYELDSNYRYEEYRVKLNEDVKEIELKAMESTDCRLIGEDGEIISSIKNNEKVKVVIPKLIEQTFRLQAKYKGKQINMYIAKTTQDPIKEYLYPHIQEIEQTYEMLIEGYIYIPIVITNYNADTNHPIVGNQFQILDENYDPCSDKMETDASGKIQWQLKIGTYYLRQIKTVQGTIQAELTLFKITGNEKVIQLNVYNKNRKFEEIKTNEKETNVTQEDITVTENHTKNINNIINTNIQKNITNQTNETNLNNVSHFINNINRRNILNLTKENIYLNEINEEHIENKVLQGEGQKLKMSRSDYINYIDLIELDNMSAPNLPIASKE